MAEAVASCQAVHNKYMNGPTIESLEKSDYVLPVGKEYIPDRERQLRNMIYEVFSVDRTTAHIGDFELLSEAVFWSIGELINNANKANNRWALLHNALMTKAMSESGGSDEEKIREDIDYAIEHNQSDMLKKYNLENLDLTASILRLIEELKTNSFALSERFQKKIDLTLRLRNRGDQKFLTINVINNSPMTVIDKKRVEYNIEKIKEDLINSGQNSFEAAVRLFDKAEDHAGGGFGAGLRSIVLFLKEGYTPFSIDVMYSKLIQYRSAAKSTIFTIELPVPEARKNK